MAINFTDKEIKEIVNQYQNGMSTKIIGEKFGVHYQTISKILKKLEVFQPKTHNWTDEDTEKLQEVYPSGNWDLILNSFPGRTRTSLYNQAAKLGIQAKNYFWTEHDKHILVTFYRNTDVKEIQKMLNYEYTIRQIQNQAKKMSLTRPKEWSKEEVEILINHYENEGSNGVKKLLPYKSNRAIIGKAMKLGITSNRFWSDDEVKFLVNNWPKLSDEEIAKKMGRGVKGVSDKRRNLGLYFPKNDVSYYDIDDFIRHRNYEWKKESMINCNYKCVITGSSDFEVHHTYSFNLILKEAMLDNEWINKNFVDYTIDELNYNLNIFLRYQSKYPLGVCLSIDMHRKFHSIYGNRINTPEQWKDFFNTYTHQ